MCVCQMGKVIVLKSTCNAYNCKTIKKKTLVDANKIKTLAVDDAYIYIP